ncbi:PBP domain containing protein [uncultured Desulfobacterium sp.]|uniref:PBP domain containing protein n=1 Tax=uncultured Desulfobacterium sp. TaxID=201089 RepID=A0A445MUI1_9BACT|nr:PBP domain containing protein [uncultured Desulfobacterium sp.]
MVKITRVFREANLVLFFSLLILICAMPAYTEGEKVLMMATTTSTDDTGLLNYLAPRFKDAKGIDLRWTATGTGKALKLGENCDVDVLMVHMPAEEKKFVEAGFGVERREIMYNDFIIIGPASDPCGIKGKPVTEAMQAIKAKQAIFVSRGDNSGTHETERLIWKAADIQVPEKESWYIQAGQGMLATIGIAAERDGYTLTDRGTYIKYEVNAAGNPPLKIMVEGDKALLNQYSVIAVNPTHCPKAKLELANEFIKWITSPEAQKIIKDYRLSGKPLFTPNAKK